MDDIELEEGQTSNMTRLADIVSKTLGCNTYDFDIVGGACVSMLQNEEPKDIDIVIHSKDIVIDRKPVFENEYCIEYKTDKGIKIQILRLRSFKPLSAVLKGFDFLHTAVGFNVSEGMQAHNSKVIDAIKGKNLYILNPMNTAQSCLRAWKFTQRGYSILPSEQRKLLGMLNNIDLSRYRREYESYQVRSM